MYKVISNLFIFLYLFFFIYSPRLLTNFNPLLAISFGTLLLLIFKYRNESAQLLRMRNIKILIIGLVLSLFYEILLLITTTQDFLSLYNNLLLLFGVLPCTMFICIYFNKRGWGITDFCSKLVFVGLVQSIFAILMFLNPGFKESILAILMNNGIGTTNLFINLSYFRVFGIATGYMFAMPVFQGFLSVLALILTFTKSTKYAFAIPFLLFSAMINARTGIIIFILGSMGVLAITIKAGKVKNLIQFSLIGAGIAFLFSQAMGLFVDSSKMTMDWIQSGMNESVGFLFGNSDGYYAVLNRMIHFPTGFDFIFGLGSNVFNTNNFISINSDIGYINDLYFGGLIFILTFYLPVFLYCLSAWKHGYLQKMIGIALFLSLCASNFKGLVICPNEFMNGYILLSTVLLVMSKQTTIPLKWHKSRIDQKNQNEIDGMRIDGILHPILEG